MYRCSSEKTRRNYNIIENKYFNAWLAGFWEGEGSLSQQTNSRGYRVAICQILRPDRNIEPAFEKIRDFFGGSLRKDTTKHYGTTITWTLYGREKVIRFVKIILPYCRFRRRQLKSVLKYFEDNPSLASIDIDIHKIIKLRQKGKSYREIGKELKINHNTIWGRLHRLEGVVGVA